MKSMLIGAALLIAGSCAAFAQQDPMPAQGGAPNAPMAAPGMAPGMAPGPAGDPNMMNDGMAKKPMMHRSMHHSGRMMHHKKMMMHHKRMMHHRKMMMHHKKMMNQSM